MIAAGSSSPLRAVLAALLFLFLALPGCATQRYPDPYEQQESIERPARPLGEEDTAPDKAGQIIVIILAVGAALGAIAAPILLLAL